MTSTHDDPRANTGGARSGGGSAASPTAFSAAERAARDEVLAAVEALGRHPIVQARSTRPTS